MTTSITEIIAKDLRGHEYLAARGLSRTVKIGGHEPESHPHCEHCNQLELLASVLRILPHWEPLKKRMRRVR